MTPLFHFQQKVDDHWVPIGAGLGEGENPMAEALGEVRELSGGALSAGDYQAIQAQPLGSTWLSFELDGDGELVGEEPAAPAAELLEAGRPPSS
jgi:hypothetical protein